MLRSREASSQLHRDFHAKGTHSIRCQTAWGEDWPSFPLLSSRWLFFYFVGLVGLDCFIRPLVPRLLLVSLYHRPKVFVDSSCKVQYALKSTICELNAIHSFLFLVLLPPLLAF
ncbi:hypothetical protein TMatcc_005836 [Talaromyces marneffei ATCC 18224]